MSTILVLIAAIIGALIHRFRGGWPDKPRWMPGHARLWATLFVLVASWFAFEPITAVMIAALYLFGSTFGWHNWMNCGDPNIYGNGPNVSWIDDALFRLFGPYWAPVSSPVEQSGEFAKIGYTVQSPIGGVRPAAWRIKVACLGMALRGLFYLPMLLVIPVLYRSADAAWLALSVLMFAPIYGLSRWIFEQTKQRITYRDDSLTLAEPLVGLLFGAVLMAQWVIATP
jgi:hypothetical protein